MVLFALLVLPKHEAANLYTLSRRTFIKRSLKSGVRDPSGSTVQFGIVAFDQEHLVWRHVARVVPFVIWIGSNVVEFGFASPRRTVGSPVLFFVQFRVECRDHPEVRVGDTASVANCKWLSLDDLERAPAVDDGPSCLAESLHVRWRHDSVENVDSSLVRLI